eukprot:CAMPEP_0168621268 /NCGR_PEP_ID=MMETSP0449_2-20121227/7596_1 /TAXON_ID=1082188 /ORGANISM="Strombidium rassoulzadegani, Strain ras09" /LENGTH=62 /DNA_ID=CAMNT_0008662361 /DNA_START=154 /DNA_END=342 /DNA_ORIENTATION=+
MPPSRTVMLPVSSAKPVRELLRVVEREFCGESESEGLVLGGVFWRDQEGELFEIESLDGKIG